MSHTTITELDAATLSADEFSERLITAALGWIETMSIHMGDRLGWYDALARRGPLTAAELAELTSTSPRYAHEWLEQQAAYGILDAPSPLDSPRSRRYRLPEGAAEVLTDRSSQAYTAPLARILAASAAQMPALVDAYRTGGGVSWAQFGDHARHAQADMNRPWLEAAPSVFARHAQFHDALSGPGARVADVGTGAGWSAIALAKAYPNLEVDGFDVDGPSIDLARINAAREGVGDRVRFHVEDASGLAAHGPFDGAVAFECVHDMPDPVSVLSAMGKAVRPEGFVVIMDEAVGEEFAGDAGVIDRMMYGFSLFVCLPDGMSHSPTAATGTVMRPSVLRGHALAAGFGGIDIVEDDFGFWRFYELVRD